MNNVCNCSNTTKTSKKTTLTLCLNWLGFYKSCEKCGKRKPKSWNTNSIISLILVVIGIQFFVSLLIFPILKKFIANDILQMIYFISVHVLLVPFYLKFALTFLLLSHKK